MSTNENESRLADVAEKYERALDLAADINIDTAELVTFLEARGNALEEGIIDKPEDALKRPRRLKIVEYLTTLDRDDGKYDESMASYMMRNVAETLRDDIEGLTEAGKPAGGLVVQFANYYAKSVASNELAGSPLGGQNQNALNMVVNALR